MVSAPQVNVNSPVVAFRFGLSDTNFSSIMIGPGGGDGGSLYISFF